MEWRECSILLRMEFQYFRDKFNNRDNMFGLG